MKKIALICLSLGSLYTLPGFAGQWLSVHGDAAPLVAGQENNLPMFVCRAPLEGGVHMGKIRAGIGGCNIPWGGKEHVLTDFELFLYPSAAQWVSVQGNNIPENAVQGGHEADKSPLYICRANYQSGQHPGKTRKAFNGCNIGYGGKEITIENYEVLVK